MFGNFLYIFFHFSCAITVNLNKFTIELDNALKSLNSDYEAKRAGNIALELPKIHILPNGVFNKWLLSNNKLGGQHKIPRLCNDRKILEEILTLI